jgi:CBS domain-containing protein
MRVSPDAGDQQQLFNARPENMMNVGEACNREVYVVRATEPLVQAAREMQKRHVGAMVVVESSGDAVRPIGIVTDRDIVRGQLTRDLDLHHLKVRDVMSTNLLTLQERASISECIARLNARAVRRAPVTDEGGNLVGIVTLDDLLPVAVADVQALANLVDRQAQRER